MELSSQFIPRPRRAVVELADGLRWTGGGGFLYTRKYDGCWQPGGLVFGRHVLIVERMKPNWFAAHSVAVLDGQNVLRESTRLRWSELQRIAKDFPPSIVLAESGHGGEFLQAVIASGGEGVCATHLDAPWGNMYACKRCETFDLIVTEMDAAQGSIRLADSSSRDRGWCVCRAEFQRVKIGDVIEVQAFGLTAKGKLRAARFRFVRPRPDKARSPAQTF